MRVANWPQFHQHAGCDITMLRELEPVGHPSSMQPL
jgi:hypothetical protein